jgi:uncharacterized protein YkwD
LRGKTVIASFIPCGKKWVLGFGLLALLVLPGAQCNSSRAPDTQTSKKISFGSVVAVPGSGVNINSAMGPNPNANALYALINSHRADLYMTALLWDNLGAACAQLHTDNMVNQNYFSLVSPKGIDLPTRMVTSGEVFAQTQYFIAQGTDDPEELMHFLVENRTTNAIMSWQPWLFMGIGYNPGNGGTWTIEFVR